MGRILNKTQNVTLEFSPLPPVMLQILQDGGLAAHVQKHGDLKLDT
jgi:3-isopropylmalate/(R)-2-methylmalate dehydratase small subunit